MARSDDIILQIAKGGLPLVLIAAEMQRDPQGILVHESSSVRSLQDLDGRVVMATPSAAWIPYVKARYGIEFELIPLNFGLGAFLADPAFIQQCLVTNEPYLARAKGARVRALMVADSGYDPYRVLAARRGFLQAEPEAAAAFVAVSIRGWEDFLFGDPTPALDEIGRRNGTLPRDQLLWSRSEVIRLALVTGKPERGERIGLLKRKRLQEELKRLADLGLIPGTLQVEDVARLDLLPKSLRDAALRP
jgi:NitT/TauT family transport system substrate-binding protein